MCVCLLVVLKSGGGVDARPTSSSSSCSCPFTSKDHSELSRAFSAHHRRALLALAALAHATAVSTLIYAKCIFSFFSPIVGDLLWRSVLNHFSKQFTLPFYWLILACSLALSCHWAPSVLSCICYFLKGISESFLSLVSESEHDDNDKCLRVVYLHCIEWPIYSILLPIDEAVPLLAFGFLGTPLTRAGARAKVTKWSWWWRWSKQQAIGPDGVSDKCLPTSIDPLFTPPQCVEVYLIDDSSLF